MYEQWITAGDFLLILGNFSAIAYGATCKRKNSWFQLATSKYCG
jgi:hypothetical protein